MYIYLIIVYLTFNYYIKRHDKYIIIKILWYLFEGNINTKIRFYTCKCMWNIVFKIINDLTK